MDSRAREKSRSNKSDDDRVQLLFDFGVVEREASLLRTTKVNNNSVSLSSYYDTTSNMFLSSIDFSMILV